MSSHSSSHPTSDFLAAKQPVGFEVNSRSRHKKLFDLPKAKVYELTESEIALFRSMKLPIPPSSVPKVAVAKSGSKRLGISPFKSVKADLFKCGEPTEAGPDDFKRLKPSSAGHSLSGPHEHIDAKLSRKGEYPYDDGSIASFVSAQESLCATLPGISETRCNNDTILELPVPNRLFEACPGETLVSCKQPGNHNANMCVPPPSSSRVGKNCSPALSLASASNLNASSSDASNRFSPDPAITDASVATASISGEPPSFSQPRSWIEFPPVHSNVYSPLYHEEVGPLDASNGINDVSQLGGASPSMRNCVTVKHGTSVLVSTVSKIFNGIKIGAVNAFSLVAAPAEYLHSPMKNNCTTWGSQQQLDSDLSSISASSDSGHTCCLLGVPHSTNSTVIDVPMEDTCMPGDYPTSVLPSDEGNTQSLGGSKVSRHDSILAIPIPRALRSDSDAGLILEATDALPVSEEAMGVCVDVPGHSTSNKTSKLGGGSPAVVNDDDSSNIAEPRNIENTSHRRMNTGGPASPEANHHIVEKSMTSHVDRGCVSDDNTVRAFIDDLDFRSHFQNDVSSMRELLIGWTTNPEALQSDHGPMFHQPCQGVKDADIPGFFYEDFKWFHFIKQGNRIVPDPTYASHLSVVLGPITTRLSEAADEIMKLHKGYKLRFDRATSQITDLEKKESISPEMHAFNYALKVVRSMKHFTSDGGKTNGEFTGNDIIDLFDAMKGHGINENSCIVDLGCGYGLVCWLAMAYLNCKTYGIELEHERSRIGAELFSKIDNDEKKNVRLNMMTAQVNLNLYFLSSLPTPTDAAYMFDNVMENPLVLHIYDMLASHRYLWMIVTGKAEQERDLKMRLSDLGFWSAGVIPCKMFGSKEPKHMGIWLRRPTQVPPPMSEQRAMLNGDCSVTTLVHAMLFGGPEQRRRAFNQQYHNICAIQEEAKRRRKLIMTKEHISDNTTCQRAHFSQCVSQCNPCDSWFQHHENDTVSRKNGAIHGQGLFAAATFRSNMFLVTVTGTKLAKPPKEGDPDRARTRQLTSSDTDCGYVLLSDNTITAKSNMFQYMNHTCRDPNCILLHWIDAKGCDCFSIVTRVSVNKNTELTYHYGSHIDWAGHCRCPSCCNQQKRTRVLLACMKYGDLGNRSVSELVSNGDWKEMDGRDTNRIIEMERQSPGLCAYTTNNNERGARARRDRHIYGDFRSDCWVKNIKQFLLNSFQEPKDFFDGVIFDDMWNPASYNHDRWGRTLYNHHIGDFAPLLKNQGYLILPCNKDVLTNLAVSEANWRPKYRLSFLSEEEQDTNLLWKAAQELGTAELFGKSNSNSTYCGISSAVLRDIREVAPKSFVVQKLEDRYGHDGLSNLRYVYLTKFSAD